MKVLIVSKYDQKGGAARAAYRLHRALVESGTDSKMLVDIKTSGDWRVKDLKNKYHKAIRIVAPHILRQVINFIFKSKNPILHSPSILPSKWIKEINKSNADLVNLHWIQDEMISIEQISKI